MTLQQSLFGAVETPSDAAEENKPTSQPLSTPLGEAVMTVIDLETTGLNPKKNAITEITAIQYKNGEEIGKFSTLVKPTEPIPDVVVSITGITDEMVKDAPPLLTVLSELADFVGPAPVIVGHNVSFDIGFLREKCHDANLAVYQSRYDLTRALCTKVLAQKAIPGLPSYEGIVVATSCGVHNPNPHRAEADVRMSAGILYAIIDRLTAQNVPLADTQALLDYQGPLR